ncbi:hypothetical protein ACQPXH_22770 [Nocardia sp. CA-135953]|uniref:hypothetical protein n=1 Tax=Nocardia sp. CA-135953 TaxID=3239978 RepID=UPI003D96C18F
MSGRLDLGCETLRLPDDPDQALIMPTTEADSPSATALALLANWAQDLGAVRCPIAHRTRRRD